MSKEEKAEINRRVENLIWAAEHIFPRNMKYWRKKLGWTQQRMADALGISRVWYNQTERGLAPCERITTLAFAYIVVETFNAQSDRTI